MTRRRGPRGTWQVDMLPSARRELLALRGSVLDRVRDAIRSLGLDPTPPDSIPMRGKGTGLHRLRVGSYRVVYRVQRERVRVLVIRIGHRGEVYRGWEDL
jgi:mRNA interferase RelE/StbE